MMRTLSLPQRHEVKNEFSLQERSVIHFTTWQLFILLYLQKFAIGPVSFQIDVPMVVMLVCLMYMLVRRRISLSPVRMGLYLVFVGCSILSHILANTIGSIPSVLELFLIYFFVTASAPLSETGYYRVLSNFIKLMIVPASIGLCQYGIQKITGGGDPISIEPFVPKSFLLRGFSYDAHYPLWYDVFQRPNGLFFLEPSFFSFFTASAAIIEATYFKRPALIALMTMATIFSFGATGFTMLLVAAPLLLARQSARLVLPLVIFGIVGVVSALMLGADLPLLSRINELDTTGASGSVRLVVPLNSLIELLSDPSYLFTGTGAGSTTSDLGSAWPMLKLTKEYGIVTMLAFVSLYASAFFGSYNIPVKIAATVIFYFTGGYLHDSVIVQFFALIFCMTEPVRSPVKSYYTERQGTYV
jgi:hypothetical protein